MEAKSSEFSQELQDIASAAKLLAHPARVAIIQYLGKQNSCMTGDISAELPLSRTTVFQHLSALKEAGWVKGEIKGSRICYCLNPEKLENGLNNLGKFVDKTIRVEKVCC